MPPTDGDPPPGGTPPAPPPTPAPPAPPADFVSTLSNEYRDPITKAGFKTADDIAKGYLHAQSALGASIRIPGADAGADDIAKFDARLAEKVPGLVRIPADDDVEGWKAFNARIGVPEAVTGYAFKPVEGVPEEVTRTLDAFLADSFLKAGIPAQRAAAVRDAMMESQRAAFAKATEDAEKAAESLRLEWGAGYDQRIARAGSAPSKVLGPEKGAALLAEIDAIGLGNSPMMAQFLDKVVEALGEDTFVPGTRSSGIPDSVSDIEAKIAEIQRNPAFQNNRDPMHKTLVDRFAKLHEQRAAVLQLSAA